jgi:Transglycosylase SLT domain
MKRLLFMVWFAVTAALQVSNPANAQHRAQYEKLVETHAKANLVPAALVHRVIVRESKYQPDLVGRGGTIGLMQIKLATARGVGYRGDAQGLRDPDTNLAFGVKYLAGAYRAANGDHDRAVHYYAAGYYAVAKQQRLERGRVKQAGSVLASAPPKDAVKSEQAAKLEESAKPEEATAKPAENALPKQATAKPKTMRKKLADAKETVPRPPASIPAGANTAKPR